MSEPINGTDAACKYCGKIVYTLTNHVPLCVSCDYYHDFKEAVER